MKVSIIVPVYNVEKYLCKCLDSLIKQSYKNIEIILINDGSTDNSLNIIHEYQKKHKNIILINQDNHGQGYARNKGIDKSTGDYVMFVDSDDYVSLNIVEKLVKAIQNCDVAICNIYKVFGNHNYSFNNYLLYGNDQVNFMLSHPGPVAKLYRKDILKKRFLENVYYEDLAFTPLVALDVSKVSYVNENLYYYVIRDNSTMKQKKFNEKINSIFKVMDYLRENLTNYPMELEFLYIEHLLYSATLRYLDYNNTKKELLKINQIMREYHDWNKNIYYHKKSIKFKMVCFLAYHKQYALLKIVKNFFGK